MRNLFLLILHVVIFVIWKEQTFLSIKFGNNLKKNPGMVEDDLTLRMNPNMAHCNTYLRSCTMYMDKFILRRCLFIVL